MDNSPRPHCQKIQKVGWGEVLATVSEKTMVPGVGSRQKPDSRQASKDCFSTPSWIASRLGVAGVASKLESKHPQVDTLSDVITLLIASLIPGRCAPLKALLQPVCHRAPLSARCEYGQTAKISNLISRIQTNGTRAQHTLVSLRIQNSTIG